MRHSVITSIAFAAGLAIVGAAQADVLLLRSVTPGSPHNTFHTRLATVIAEHTDHELQVSMGVAPPAMLIELASGDGDFAFSAPTITNWMRGGKAMYSKVPGASEMYNSLRSIVSHNGGFYTFVVFADSGIDDLDDIRDRRVYLSFRGGAANRVLVSVIEAVTGMKPDADYSMSPLDTGAGIQAFQDGQLDLYGAPAVQPNPVIEQFALTREIRLLSIPEEAFETEAIKGILALPGRSRAEIPSDMYGDNQVNEEPVQTIGTTNMLVTGVHVDEQVVYDVTRAMWENIDKIHAAGAYMPNLINRETAFFEIEMPLHAGAYRYYVEAGFDVPDHLTPPEAR